MKPSSWCLYILRCADGSLYTGICTDIARRLRQHNGELAGGARYTRGRRPVELVYHETCDNRAHASKREAEIKQYSKQRKQKLFQSV